MKTNQIITSLLLVVNISIACGQVPVGFNYQGVLRNSQGESIPGTPAEIVLSIHSDNENGTLVWQETHNIITDLTGAFSMVIGNDPEKRSGGLLDEFLEMDWGADQYFLKVHMNGEDMGTARLMSVPYAALAQDVVNGIQGEWTIEGKDLYFDEGNVAIGSGTANSRLTVQGDPDANIDTALFEVKNIYGEPVFAVYNEGVRVYIEEENVKGAKGGFAVGGYRTGSKAEPREFLRVTSDSVRIWLNEPAGKALKGGFAVGGYSTGKAESSSFMELDPENYFIGHKAGAANENGIYNSFFGYQAGTSNTIGSQNIFIGYKAGFNNTEGVINAFIGNHSGYSNTTGHENVFIGDSSGYHNETGYWNVFLGERTGKMNYSGRSNVFIGDKAGEDNTTGNYNVFMGSIAGWNNVDGSSNVFIGSGAGGDNISGTDNTIIGSYAGRRNIIGNTNIFLGRMAGYTNTTGSDNIYIGNQAGAYSDTTYSNIFIGNNSGEFNQSGLANVFLGNRTGNENVNGSNNTILGHESGHFKTKGDLNTFVGAYAGHLGTTGERNTFIGANAGLNSEGDGNIFIGEAAGYHESGSDKLYIQNSPEDSTGALIYGDFIADMLTFNGRVGINTNNPGNDLHVTSRSNSYSKLMVGERDSIVGYSEFAGSAAGPAGGSVRLGTSADFDDIDEYWQVSVWEQNFQIGTQNNFAWFEITPAGTILHRGDELHADHVFSDDYALESIEEHAEFMWSNLHLPAVPPAVQDDKGNDVVNLGARNKGVLEELEKAHIYIQQLNDRIKVQEEMLLEMKKEIETLKSARD